MQESQDGMAVVLFQNTQAAIQAEHLLQSDGVTGKLIPIPRQFGAECGLAFRFSLPERRRIEALLERAGIQYGSIHEL
jgi:hypothetical protein